MTTVLINYGVVKVLKKDKSQKEILNGTKAYIELRKQVTEAGILDRAYGYYTLNTIFTYAGLFLCIYEIIKTPVSIQLVFWSFLMAIFTVQIGGLLHDCGHRAVAKTPKWNDILGLIYATSMAMGFTYWRHNHNKHHSHTNQEDEDPDLDLPLHGFTSRQFAKQKGVWKYLRKYQFYLLFPLRSIVGFSQRLDSIRYFKKERTPGAIVELIFWIVSMFVWFVLPFLVFPFVKALIFWTVLHMATGVYLSQIFAPNHKGMPQVAKGIKISFLEHQIMTSRNVNGNWLTDYIYMGLNYQIEHHLFVNCPRNKLKLITPYVKKICKQMKLEYTSVSINESNRQILEALREIAAAPPKPKKAH